MVPTQVFQKRYHLNTVTFIKQIYSLRNNCQQFIVNSKIGPKQKGDIDYMCNTHIQLQAPKRDTEMRTETTKTETTLLYFSSK